MAACQETSPLQGNVRPYSSSYLFVIPFRHTSSSYLWSGIVMTPLRHTSSSYLFYCILQHLGALHPCGQQATSSYPSSYLFVIPPAMPKKHSDKTHSLTSPGFPAHGHIYIYIYGRIFFGSSFSLRFQSRFQCVFRLSVQFRFQSGFRLPVSGWLSAFRFQAGFRPSSREISLRAHF